MPLNPIDRRSATIFTTNRVGGTSRGNHIQANPTCGRCGVPVAKFVTWRDEARGKLIAVAMCHGEEERSEIDLIDWLTSDSITATPFANGQADDLRLHQAHVAHVLRRALGRDGD